jgi:hypothetical protein
MTWLALLAFGAAVGVTAARAGALCVGVVPVLRRHRGKVGERAIDVVASQEKG